MSYVFELFINKDEITKEAFAAFNKSIASNSGLLKKIRYHITLHDNHMRYFIESEKDLSSLSSANDFCTLQPVEAEEIATPENPGKQGFFTLPSGGNLLNLQEKMSTKKNIKLEHFICETRWLTDKYDQVSLSFYFNDAAGQPVVAKKTAASFPSHLFAVDFSSASNIIRSEVPKYLNIEKSLKWMSPESHNSILEVNTFPYLTKPYYLNLGNFEFDKHSMIVGASGSGKSKFIELFIDRIHKMPTNNNYRIVVVDPHANLATDLQNSSAGGSMQLVDFGSDSAELFAGAEADVTGATELTTTLMKSLIGVSWNSQVERVLRMTLFVLFTAKNMSMGNLKRFLIETELRQQILDHVDGHVPNNIIHFFGTDFNEIRTAHYEKGLLPIISIVDEMELQPTFLAEGGLSLQKSINENFLTVFSLNKVSMGEKVVKTVAGLLIQQIFLLAQSKAFNQKVLLFIDEVSVVQTPALASILSEARKYNLFVILTQQYFTQVEKGLSDAIFANVSNYYCFRVSEEDATQLVGNLTMEIPKEIAVESKEKGVKEEVLKARFLTELHPRECIVRISAGGKILPSFKAKTVDISYDALNGYRPVSEDYQASRKPMEAQKVSPEELKPFEESAPIAIDDFFDRAESAITTQIQKPPDFSVQPVDIENEYTNKDVSQLLQEAHPEAFRSDERTELLPGEGTGNTNIESSSQSKIGHSPVDATILAPTVLRFAMSGVPVVDRGMPDLSSLMKQESTKTSVE